MNPKRIVITGGPSTGKTSLINTLKHKDLVCYDEISRSITLQARQEGVEQLFLTNPLLFSQKLLEGRIQQFINASKEKKDVVFLDRGLCDVLAYMEYIGDTYPQFFNDACKQHIYDKVFMLEPWEAIYTRDNERYESFDQAQIIHKHLLNTYHQFGYKPIIVPIGKLEDRVAFILDVLDL